MPKRKQVSKSIEDIYCNRFFVPPKEQNLETIFEEPRQSKDGAPILTSVKKYKRYLHFDPSQNKIQKRKQKAKKCLKKLKLNIRVTRSSPKSTKSTSDVSLDMMDILDDISNDGDMDMSRTNTNATNKAIEEKANTETKESLLCEQFNIEGYKHSLSLVMQRDKDLTDTSDEVGKDCDTEESESNSHIKNEEAELKNATTETMESPRRSCCIS